MSDEHPTSERSDAQVQDPPIVADDHAADAPRSSDADGDGVGAAPADRSSLGIFGEFPKPPIWQSLLALALYIGLWAIWTWPLLEAPNRNLLGAIGDQTGFLSLYRELHQEGLLGFLPGTIPDFAAPEGLKYGWVNLFGQAPASLLASVLFVVFPPLAAVAAYGLIGTVGSAFAMYQLARRLSGSGRAAFVAGVGCGFAPYLVFKSAGHADFAHAWVFVLMLWAWLRLIDAPSWKRTGIAAAATVLAAAWTAYFALLAGVAGVVLALVLIGTQVRARHTLRSIAMAAAAGAPAVVWIGLTLIVANSDPNAVTQPTRSLHEMMIYAARPLEYVMPTGQTALVGEAAGEWRAANYHGSNLTESLLYLGISVLLLALVGLVVSLKQRRNRGLIAILAAVGFTAMWFSFPPLVAIGGELIPTPSRYVFEVQPGFRVYSRFVVLVIVALAPVVALGVAAILGRLRFPLLKVAVTGGLVFVIYHDLHVGPLVNPTNDPPAYTALRKQPPGIVGEFPFVPATQELNQATYYQQLGNHPILNGYREGSIQEARALLLNDLSSPATMDALRGLNVRYLMVRKDFEQVGWPDPGEPPANDVELIAEDGSLKLYRLKPGKGSFAFWYGNTGAVEFDADKRPFQWLTASKTQLKIYNPCASCKGEALIKLNSFGVPRDVTLDSGIAKKVVKVTPTSSTFRIPIQMKRGTATVNLTATPGPVRPSDLIPGNTDNRQLSLSLYSPKIEFDNGG